MTFWNKYSVRIKRNCAGSDDELKDLAYRRNNLFANTIIYLLPFCLIALTPGIYWCFVTRLYMLLVVDIFTIAGLFIIAFMPGIDLALRKIIFSCCIYSLSCVMIYYGGLYGPGLLYLQAACIFSILIFQTSYTFWPAWLNTLICIFFGVAKTFHIVPWPNERDQSIGAWVAVSSNLVFLSFLLAALIPRIFNGLQETIDKEKQLKEELNKQQRSLEQALNMLQQKNDELEQFSYAASHDLKEPLRMVKSFVKLLENKYSAKLDDTARKFIHFAVDGASRMEALINDLLEYSHAGKTNNDIEEIKICEIIEEVKQLHGLIIEEKGVIIKTTELPQIQASRTAIRQVFQNLIGNAIKYQVEGVSPIICVSTKETGTHWQFAITDNGIGISQDNWETIFTIFKRLHGKEIYSGTGIGLAICKKIVEQNGGKIWVRSELGSGSTFYWTIAKVNK